MRNYRAEAPRALLLLVMLLAAIMILTGTPIPLQTVHARAYIQDSPEELAYYRILDAEYVGSSHHAEDERREALIGLMRRSERPDVVLKAALIEAEPAGQIYALAGLAVVDPVYVREVLPRYRHTTSMVGVMYGCELEEEEMSDVVERVTSPEFSNRLRVAVYGR